MTPSATDRAGPVAGLLLAAGGGRRMGMPKALVALGGSLLVERGVALLAGAGCAPVVVVLGARADEVLARAELRPARPVVNPHWEEGLGSSLRAGLTALAGSTAGAVVVSLADQPLVGGQAVERLVAAWRGGAHAAVATYGGRPRNPVLLDRGLWDEVSDSAIGDEGARGFLRRAGDRVTPVACDGTGSPDDLDTPHDLAALSARLDGTPRRQEQPCS